MKVDLSGKVAMVTGAARGIGKAIADVLAENGARVIYTDIETAAAREAAAKYPLCKAVEMNVADKKQVDAVVQALVSEFGHLDIVVNNAGVNTIKHRVTTEQFPSEEWNRIIDVDLTGVYIVSHAVARVMVAQQSGRIINISSIAGQVALRLQSPYVAAKHGVIGLTRAMAIELGPQGVLVNAIAPGSTLTEGTKQLFYGEDGKFRDAVQRLLDHIPLGRPGEAEEIAHAALFLAAPESSYITGTVLTVDGGWTAGGFARDF
ncbi:MAG: SDR family oxidoreductase [Phycisphaerae bacterium]|nr:SDR family oxidoreductase [Phycisphaerae bacterium]